jgi:hypothetical protein
MALEEKIDEKHNRITIKGTQEELQRFLYCMEEVLTRGALKETITQIIKENKLYSPHNQINFTMIHRAYLSKNEILIVPNAGNQKFYFQ